MNDDKYNYIRPITVKVIDLPKELKEKIRFYEGYLPPKLMEKDFDDNLLYPSLDDNLRIIENGIYKLRYRIAFQKRRTIKTQYATSDFTERNYGLKHVVRPNIKKCGG